MICRVIPLPIAVVALPLTILGQNAPAEAPLPSDPLELVTGPVQVVDTPGGREDAVQLLARARNSYALRSAGQAYDLKVSFTVNSGGQTQYDGDWEMEEIFDPQQGLRWTAKAAAGYTTTQISVNKLAYGQGTTDWIPLRLHEARATLFGAIGNDFSRTLIRTSTATYNGRQVTCILLSGSGNAPTAAQGRRWEEVEECIDPQSGLLQVHSRVPGRYYAYDYANAPKLGDRTLPRKVIVTEGGKAVAEVRVESLTEPRALDPTLFVPTDEMKAKGPAVAMVGARRLFPPLNRAPIPSGSTVQAVCVFGLVAPSGQLIEAHSLQPSDPNSQAAVERAKSMTFLPATPPGARPEQYFVFIVQKFVESQ